MLLIRDKRSDAVFGCSDKLNSDATESLAPICNTCELSSRLGIFSSALFEELRSTLVKLARARRRRRQKNVMRRVTAIKGSAIDKAIMGKSE